MCCRFENGWVQGSGERNVVNNWQTLRSYSCQPPMGLQSRSGQEPADATLQISKSGNEFKGLIHRRYTQNYIQREIIPRRWQNLYLIWLASCSRDWKYNISTFWHPFSSISPQQEDWFSIGRSILWKDRAVGQTKRQV